MYLQLKNGMSRICFKIFFSWDKDKNKQAWQNVKTNWYIYNIILIVLKHYEVINTYCNSIFGLSPLGSLKAFCISENGTMIFYS